MKVMVLVKATKNSEAGVLPTEELFAAMTKYNQELAAAGIMRDGDGLQPSVKGKRIHISGKKRAVVDGPFAETKELVAGYWVWEVKSMEEAVDWARRCPEPMPGEEAILEIRPFYELTDFGEAFTPAVAAEQEKLRATLDKQARR